ncbi:hypothetical protein M569_14642, partial [Genlisea aurea]
QGSLKLYNWNNKRIPNPAAKMTTLSSAMIYKTISGTHEFTIQGHSLSKLFDSKHEINSEIFTVGDHSWSISFYPLGYGKGNDANVSIYLYLVDGVGDVKVNYDITLLDQS